MCILGNGNRLACCESTPRFTPSGALMFWLHSNKLQSSGQSSQVQGFVPVNASVQSEMHIVADQRLSHSKQRVYGQQANASVVMQLSRRPQKNPASVAICCFSSDGYKTM